MIDTLLDKKDDEWFHDLYKMNIFLEFTGNGHGIHPIDMPAFTFMSVHPVPRRPVYIFDNDFIIPEYNSRNESQSDFCKEVKIEMKPIRGRLADNLSLTFFYETTPGVSPKDLARLC